LRPVRLLRGQTRVGAHDQGTTLRFGKAWNLSRICTSCSTGRAGGEQMWAVLGCLIAARIETN
jgi:hypothetical protein